MKRISTWSSKNPRNLKDKTVVSQTEDYFQLWHGTPNEPIAGNKIDEEETRNLFGQDVTHFVKHTTKGNGMYQLPPGSSHCTIVTKKHPLYRWDESKINFWQGKEETCVYSSFSSAFHHCGWTKQAKNTWVMPWKIVLLEGSHSKP